LAGAGGRHGRWVRRRAAARTTEDQVLVAWAEVTELLAWWRVTRRPSETYLEFERRAASRLRVPLGFDHDATAGLRQLSVDATAAEFAAGMLPSEVADRARETAEHVRRALVGVASKGQRLRLLADPRLAFGRRLGRDGALRPRPRPDGPSGGPGPGGGPSGGSGPAGGGDPTGGGDPAGTDRSWAGAGTGAGVR
jgi:hypothetical protein